MKKINGMRCTLLLVIRGKNRFCWSI